jgi:hypothetical protein
VQPPFKQGLSEVAIQIESDVRLAGKPSSEKDDTTLTTFGLFLQMYKF